jgi:D-alanyl-lipoteichoic acid acyltransferase DltB (MBOAT superfamily)
VPFEVIAILKQIPLVVTFFVFPMFAVMVLRNIAWRRACTLLTLFSIGLLPVLCILGTMGGVRLKVATSFAASTLPWIAVYVATVVTSWLLLRAWGQETSRRFWIAFAFPLLVMVAVRFFPGAWHFYWSSPKRHIAEVFIGVSYMAFRLSHLALQYRNLIVPLPTLGEYLAFAFFPPTLSVGPISPYSVFLQGSKFHGHPVTAPFQCVLRFLLGLTKYFFLANLVNQLSYSGLLLDSHPHKWMDFPIAVVCSYLYLYLNFSGWCDMAIGAAGLVGIPVAENFDHPFLARNIQEYWTRWHMTLTGYMRDVVFTPLSKVLVRYFGPKNAKLAIAGGIFCVFMGMGFWHGIAWNFFIYYFLHGSAVVTVHYYTGFLKKRLGREGYARYEANPWIRRSGIALTFAFNAGSMFFFVNPVAQMGKIMDVFR